MGTNRVGVKGENSEEEKEEWRGKNGKKMGKRKKSRPTMRKKQMRNKKVGRVSWKGEKEKENKK